MCVVHKLLQLGHAHVLWAINEFNGNRTINGGLRVEWNALVPLIRGILLLSALWGCSLHVSRIFRFRGKARIQTGGSSLYVHCAYCTLSGSIAA